MLLDRSSSTYIERLAKLRVALCRPLMAPRLAPRSGAGVMAFGGAGNGPSWSLELVVLAPWPRPPADQGDPASAVRFPSWTCSA
jgi:hypothetical protein